MDYEHAFLEYRSEIISTVVVVTLLYLIRAVVGAIAKRRINKFEFSQQRKVIIGKVLNILLFFATAVSLIAIWGLRSEDILLFISSAGTIFGVAFFAQWSILSNITASLILFFNHPIKIGGKLKVVEKDSQIEGTVVDITSFFIRVKPDEGPDIVVPTSIILQKAVSTD